MSHELIEVLPNKWIEIDSIKFIEVYLWDSAKQKPYAIKVILKDNQTTLSHYGLTEEEARLLAKESVNNINVHKNRVIKKTFDTAVGEFRKAKELYLSIIEANKLKNNY